MIIMSNAMENASEKCVKRKQKTYKIKILNVDIFW